MGDRLISRHDGLFVFALAGIVAVLYTVAQVIS